MESISEGLIRIDDKEIIRDINLLAGKILDANKLLEYEDLPSYIKTQELTKKIIVKLNY